MNEMLALFIGLTMVALAVVFGLPSSTWSFVFAGFAVLVLYPFRKSPATRWFFWTSAVFLMFFLFTRFEVIFIPLGFGILITFILDPIVSMLERVKIPRPISSFVTVLLFALVTLFLIAVVVYQAGNQAAYLVSVLPDQISKWRATLETYFRERHLWEFLTQMTISTNVLENIARQIGELPLRLFGVANYLFFYLVTLVTAFYLLIDRRRILAFLWNWLDERGYSETLAPLFEEIALVLRRYFRGQLLDATLVGVLTGLLLFIFRIKFALLLGFLAGLMNLVPNIGFWASYIPALLVGLMDPSPLWGVIRVSIVFGGVQLMESVVFAPRIIGGSVGLHPLVILFSLLIGAKLLGILGMLLAVPVAALLKALWLSPRSPEESS